jgi:[histone H3]-lysine36 N-dimethyltransferase SETMAR
MGQHALSLKTAERWFRQFKSGNYELQDEPHPGRQSVIDEDALLAAIEADPLRSCRDLEKEFGHDHSTIALHLHNLGKTWKWGRWIPHQLTSHQLELRVSSCMSLLTFKRTTGWLTNLITQDEKYVQYATHARKRQWLSSDQAGVSTPKPDRFALKTLLSVWWGIKGVVHWELLQPGETVDAKKYCQQLDEVAKKLKGKQDEVYYQHDNAPPHTAKMTRAKILGLGWKLVPHPPYSPDIAPSDYHLFRSMQHQLDEHDFHDYDALKSWMAEFFASHSSDFYKSGIESLPTRWQDIIDNDGQYIVEK